MAETAKASGAAASNIEVFTNDPQDHTVQGLIKSYQDRADAAEILVAEANNEIAMLKKMLKARTEELSRATSIIFDAEMATEEHKQDMEQAVQDINILQAELDRRTKEYYAVMEQNEAACDELKESLYQHKHRLLNLKEKFQKLTKNFDKERRMLLSTIQDKEQLLGKLRNEITVLTRNNGKTAMKCGQADIDGTTDAVQLAMLIDTVQLSFSQGHSEEKMQSDDKAMTPYTNSEAPHVSTLSCIDESKNRIADMTQRKLEIFIDTKEGEVDNYDVSPPHSPRNHTNPGMKGPQGSTLSNDQTNKRLSPIKQRKLSPLLEAQEEIEVHDLSSAEHSPGRIYEKQRVEEANSPRLSARPTNSDSPKKKQQVGSSHMHMDVNASATEEKTSEASQQGLATGRQHSNSFKYDNQDLNITGFAKGAWSNLKKH